MLTYIFYFFLAYLLYNLVFKFVLPIYRTTKQVKRSFRDMQERMQQPAQGGEAPKPAARKTPQPAANAEYIDFEEVKE